MPSLADAVATIQAAGAPVLFLDTCSILDVIRSPERGLAGCVESAGELVRLATPAPAGWTLVVGSLVPEEWADHDQQELQKLEAHLARMERQASDFHAFCGHLGLSVRFTQPDYATSGLAGALHSLSKRLLQASLPLDPDPGANNRAFARVVTNPRRPSKKGGQIKDCVIFEECLEVARQLQASGFGPKVVFCTSNTADYCDPGATPHSDVKADCDAVGMTFTTTLPWALSVLKS